MASVTRFKNPGKTETFPQDLRYVYRKMGLAPPGPSRENVSKRGAAGSSSSTLRSRLSKPAKEYFKELSARRRRRLRELYALDFELFGYSDEGYL